MHTAAHDGTPRRLRRGAHAVAAGRHGRTTTVALRRLAPGHYCSDLPLAGRWRVQATVRLDAGNRVELAGNLRIR